MDTSTAHADLIGMGAGQSVERLRDAADAGAAVHVVDTEGECGHEFWMLDSRFGRYGSGMKR